MLRPVSRDSAGVELLEHNGTALQSLPQWTIDTTAPVALIGPRATAPTDVSGIFAFTLLADGSLAGFHRREAAVVTFRSDGREIARYTASDSSGGPFGLFLSLADVHGDSLVASDITNNRFAVITPSGGIARWAPAVLRDGRDFYAVAGRLGDGSWLLRPGYVTVGGPVRAAGALPARRAALPLGRVRAGAAETGFDTLTMVPGIEIVRAPLLTDQGVQYLDLPAHLGARSHVVRWGDQAAVITNEDWSIQRFDGAGILRSIVRINAPKVAVTDTLRDALVPGYRLAAARRWAGHVDSVRRVSEIDSVVATLPLPDSIAPYERMHLAPGRRLWLQETQLTPTDPVRLIGFELDGRLVGRLVVQLPEGGEVAAMGDDRMVIRVTLGERQSYVVVYRIRPQ